VTAATFALWRRLDVPGHDGCELVRDGDGWRLDGTAVFRDGGALARLHYAVGCDAGWVTGHGRVSGRLGQRAVDLTIRRSDAGAWSLNGVAIAGLEDCLDLDLGFTPATNALQLRRVALKTGEARDVPVAWLDVAAGTLSLLHQRYERRTETGYWYEAPRFDYAAMLEVTPGGFVRAYPSLWEMELDAGQR
jgi:hypothetical protein